MTVALAMLCFFVGLVHVVPGVLPVAANQVLRYGRQVVGGGLIVIAAGKGWLAIRGYTGDALTDLGLWILVLGMGTMAFVIWRQPCDPKA